MTTDWRLEGDGVKNCSCAYGCPCDVNARPTQGWCKGLLAMHVRKGVSETRISTAPSSAVVVEFPGPGPSTASR